MTMEENVEAVESHLASLTGQRYLRFSLGVEEFAIPLLSVREVIAPPEVTPIPQTPNYFVGIMNLRGQVITVLDLRTKLGIKPLDGAEKSVIIVDLGALCIGVTVDSVNAVLSPKSDEISGRPDLPQNKSSQYISGVYRSDKGLVLMLDISRVLNAEDQFQIQSVKAKAA